MMDGFTLIDAGCALVLLLSAVLAYSRGFVREILSILGWIIAAIVAFYYAHLMAPLVLEIPVLSDILSGSCDLTMLTAAFFVFILALIVVAILTPLFAGAIQRSVLSGFDQILGLLFGMARGIALILAALIAYDLVGIEIAMVETATSKALLGALQEQIQSALLAQGVADGESWSIWGQTRYNELTASCRSEAVQP